MNISVLLEPRILFIRLKVSFTGLAISMGVWNGMSVGILYIFLALCCCASDSARAKPAYEYRVQYPVSSVKLQSDIDRHTIAILQTRIGKAICKDILAADEDLIRRNLGVTSTAAQIIASNCKSTRPNSSPYVVPSPATQKNSLLPATADRTFVVVYSNNLDLGFDSWTEPFTNRTVLILNSSSSLLKILTHELMIYFDAKSWPGGPNWWSLPDLGDTILSSSDSNRSVLATQNPVIAQILAAIRAFKLEVEVLKDLHEQPDAALNHSFLKLDCDEHCLFHAVKDSTYWVRPYLVDLLAFSPRYRAEILQSAVVAEWREVLEEYPRQRIQQLDLSFSLLGFFQKPEVEVQLKTERIIFEELFPMDLKVLLQTNLQKFGTEQSINFLKYLGEPLLSGNANQSAMGPRPRIRTGNLK